LAEDAVPDESTIMRFRRLLEQHQLSQKIFAQVRTLLEDKRLLLKSGTIVDATIIEAPTKDAERLDQKGTRLGMDRYR
jgi:transposase, IS5 family